MKDARYVVFTSSTLRDLRSLLGVECTGFWGSSRYQVGN